MRFLHGDTIAAAATPPGQGGIGVIRISGPRSDAVARLLTGVRLPPPRRAVFRSFRDQAGGVIDQGLLLRFAAPASFTGEAMAEVQAHGSPVVLDLLLRRLTELGARPAAPGEFSRRAFENGRYDLSQLEAVDGLIRSATAQAAKSAQRTVQGEFSRLVAELREALMAARVSLESSIDFSDEDIEFASAAALRRQLSAAVRGLGALRRRAAAGRRLHAGVEAVMVGCPNVGKSSLLNRLAGRDEAIVSATAGTTRDSLKCGLSLGGLPLRLWDTAGLRKPRGAVEREGVERAYAAAAAADLVLVVVDAARRAATSPDAFPRPLKTDAPCLTVCNKIDLIAAPDGEALRECGVSAKTGAGVDALIARITETCGGVGDDALMVQQRHLAALDEADAALRSAAQQAAHAELAAEELRCAQQALEGIAGEVTTEALLGEIFSRFCIGK